MRRIVAFLVLAGLLVVMTGCSKSPRDVGFTMAEKHLQAGMNPSPAQTAGMQQELSREIEGYSLVQKQEFMQGYLEAVAAAVQKRAMTPMCQATQQGASQPPFHASR